MLVLCVFFLEWDVATLYQSAFQQDLGKLGQEKTDSAQGKSKFQKNSEKGLALEAGLKMKKTDNFPKSVKDIFSGLRKLNRSYLAG